LPISPTAFPSRQVLEVEHVIVHVDKDETVGIGNGQIDTVLVKEIIPDSPPAEEALADPMVN